MSHSAKVIAICNNYPFVYLNTSKNKMFKIVLVASFLLASAYANEDFDNFIDHGYGDNHFRRVALPYAYQYPREERVVVKPFVEESDSRLLVSPEVALVTPDVAAVIELSKIGFLAKAASFTFALGKKAFVFILANAPALILGTLAAFGLCKFTPICSKISALKSFVEIKNDISAYATPEHLASAAQFVQAAVRKYRSLQD